VSARASERGERAQVSVRVVDAVRVWFTEVRAPMRQSPNTTDAYRNDLRSLLLVIARQLETTTDVLTVTDIAPLSVMRRAFGEWTENGPNGQPRAKRSIKRAHSTWTVFFEYLVSEELVPGSPMPGVGKPKKVERQPKPFKAAAAARIVTAVQDGAAERRDPWPELDRAIVLTDMITGARSAELLDANIADVNRTPRSEGIRITGKGGYERTAPIEPVLLDVLAAYLDTRRARFPELARKRAAEGASAWDWWPPDAPLFVDRTGERMRRGALKYLIGLVYRAAGVEAERASGALTHALRHTAATRAAENGATVIELMQLFGWQSLSTPQNYIEATGREVRAAARTSPVYAQLAGEVAQVD